MCGRFTLEPTARFYDRFKIENRLEGLTPRYNIAPRQIVPVIVHTSPNRVVLMRWGLVPHWAKEGMSGYKLINARAETLAEKPVYRGLLKSHRCLVPASGFYEWRAGANGKRPYYITLKEQELFAFAGLYDVAKDAQGKDLATFTIITTAPNRVMAKIHDRMPVILDPDEEAGWLDPGITDQKALVPMLDSYAGSAMELYPVSTLVNRPQNDFKSLIKRMGQS
jgi:putative SOS response-associated peptidase YedK